MGCYCIACAMVWLHMLTLLLNETVERNMIIAFTQWINVGLFSQENKPAC